MWGHRPCDARTTHSEGEVETQGPPSVAGSPLERLQIAEWHCGLAEKAARVLEREIVELEQA
jgi:hypothetical protein